MRTILVIFGLWLLINVLVVVIMMPPSQATVASSTSAVPTDPSIGCNL